MTVATSLSVDKTFKARIFVDKRKLPCYSAKSSRKSASCYVASQANKAFTVEFDRGNFEQHKLQIVLLIDGIKVDSRLQCPKDENADPQTRFEYLETDSGTKEFRFSEITADMIDGDTQNGAGSSEALPIGFGTIELVIYRAANVRRISQAKAEKQKDPEDNLVLPMLPRAALSNTYHRVVFADKDDSASQSDHESDCDSVTSCGSHDCNFDQKEQLATLTFKYRPLAVLQSVGVVNPRNTSNTPGVAATATAPRHSNRPRRSATSTSSAQGTSADLLSSTSTPPPRLATSGGSSASASGTRQPTSPAASASNSRLPQRNTQRALPTLAPRLDLTRLKIPSKPSIPSAATATAATFPSTTPKSSTTTRPHSGPLSNSFAPAPVFIERLRRPYAIQLVTAPPSSISASDAEQPEAKRPTRNANKTVELSASTSNSNLTTHSYTPEPTCAPVAEADAGHPDPSHGVPKQAKPSKIQTGTSISSGNDGGASGAGHQRRTEKPPGDSGETLTMPSLPAKTASHAQRFGQSGQAPAELAQTMSASATQKPVAPPAVSTKRPVRTKREPDIVVKSEPREVEVPPMDQDDENASADEDKQDKWDLERLKELHNRKRKRKQDCKARSGQMSVGDAEDDDVDDQISSLITKLTQSNKKRRMRRQKQDVIDLSWM